jgi:hypothetical protein
VSPLQPKESSSEQLRVKTRFNGWLLVALIGCAANGAGLIYVATTRGGNNATKEPPEPKPAVATPVPDRAAGLADWAELIRNARESSGEADDTRARAEGRQAESVPAEVPAPKPPPIRDVMQDVLTHETRDAAWASGVENKFLTEAKNQGVTVERIQCGSARCALSMTTADRGVLGRVPGWFGDGETMFEGRREGRGYAVQMVYVRSGYDLRGVKKTVQ